MIIKNFLNKLEISKYTLIFIFICFITGLIKEIIAISILIIIHEFGHYLISYIYKWNIKKIVIYPFGGLINYEEQIDKPLKEEFLITVFGPINQIIIFIIFYLLFKNNIVSEYFYLLMKRYNYSILLFNIIPIIPLDGSKVLNIILNKIFNFRLSYNISGYLSFIFLILFFFRYKNIYGYYMMISFFIIEFIKYIKNKSIIYNRFIYEKYLYNNKYKNYITINNIKKMKRNKKHIFKKDNCYYSEKQYIKKRSYTPNKVYNMVHNNKGKGRNK